MKNIDSRTKQYIDLKKVENVRTNLAGIAYFCTPGTFKTFVDTAEYAKEHLDDLFENNIFPYEAASRKGISRESYKKAVELLMDNFSKEKYEDVINIGNVLFKTTKANNNAEKKNEYDNGRKNNSKTIHEKNEQNSSSSLIIGVAAVVVAFLVYKLIK